MQKLAILAAVVLLAGGLISGIGFAVGAGDGAGQSGSYPIQLNLNSDPCGHDPYIFSQQPPPHNMKLQVVLNAGFISITGPAPWVAVSGTIDNNDDFSATGIGTVAGFQNIHVTFLGHLANGVLTGSYAFGSSNDLPECTVNGSVQAYPAVYQVKPKGPTATRTPTTTRTPEPTSTFPPPPTYVPPSNGTCEVTGHNIYSNGQTWDDRWKCTEADAFVHFNRIDVSIGAPAGQPGVDEEEGVDFHCQAGHLWQGFGQFKGRQVGVNPDPQQPDHEVWSFDVADYCTVGVEVYFNHGVQGISPTIKSVAFSFVDFGTPTATSRATPAFPTENGSCIQLAVDVPINNVNYDLWNCSANDINVNFNRVDIAVVLSLGDLLVVDQNHPPIFVCQTGLGSQQVGGVSKGYREGVNPGSAPDDDIWSGEFPEPCTEGKATAYVRSQVNKHLLIKKVAFTTVSIPTATATAPGPTATASSTATPLPPSTATRTNTPLQPPTPIKLCGDVNDDQQVNSIDATLILQYDAGMLTRPVIIPLANLASGDTNFDGRINSIDATIDLQIDAGLLDRCLEVI